MPAYELFLIVRDLARADLVQSIKRSAQTIIEKKGIIRSFENLGYKKLPYRIKAKGAYHTNGNYILVKFDVPRTEINTIATEMSKDKDFLRTGVSPLVDLEEFKVKCQCEEKGEFVKNPFNFQNPMTSWDKKKIYKNYGLRL